MSKDNQSLLPPRKGSQADDLRRQSNSPLSQIEIETPIKLPLGLDQQGSPLRNLDDFTPLSKTELNSVQKDGSGPAKKLLDEPLKSYQEDTKQEEDQLLIPKKIATEEGLSAPQKNSSSGGLTIWNRCQAIIDNPRAYFALAWTAEDELPQLSDLKTNLGLELQELEDNITSLQLIAQTIRQSYARKHQAVCAMVQEWKLRVIRTQMTKSEDTIQLLTKSKGLAEKVANASQGELSHQGAHQEGKSKAVFEYHEHFCANHTTSEEASDELKEDSIDGLPEVALVAPNDSKVEQEQRKPTKEGTVFINKLVEVLFEAWKNAEVFHKLIAEVSYIPLNLHRDKSLGEIKIEGMKFEGKAPEILWLKQSPTFMMSDPTNKTLCYDGELHFQGKIKLLITTSYKLNLLVQNFYNIPIKLEIAISRINGKVRLQYSTDPAQGSYLQFLGRPAIKVEVEPVVGEESQVNLNSLPKVTSIITRIVNDQIDELCFPGFLQMDIPCTTESTSIDKDGKPIRKTKPIDGIDPQLIDKLISALEDRQKPKVQPTQQARPQVHVDSSELLQPAMIPSQPSSV